MTVAIKIRHPRYLPAGRKSWTVRAADENVVVQIPDRCLTRAGVLKYIIRFSVAVKIGYPDQCITTCNRRCGRAADANVVVQIPDRRLARSGIEQGIICMTVAIKIRHRRYLPAGRKSWTVGAADENVVVQIPDRCLTRAGVLKHIIRRSTGSGAEGDRQCDAKWQNWYFFELSERIHGSSFLNCEVVIFLFWLRSFPFIPINKNGRSK